MCSDSVKDALFVYELPDRRTGRRISARQAQQESRAASGRTAITIWVSDDGAKRLFAYEVDGEALKRNGRTWSSRSARS